MFVLDGSVALAMLLPDEHSAEVDALADRFAEGAAAVPAIWPLEVLPLATVDASLRKACAAQRIATLP